MNSNFSEEQTRSALNEREREAEELLKDKKKTSELLDKAKKLLEKIKNIPVIGGLVDDITMTIELIGEFVSGTYRKVPVRVIVSALAAIIYLVSPIDLIPDLIPGLGFIDDAAVLTLVLGTGLSLELKKYRKCKQTIEKDAIVNNIKGQLVNETGNESLIAVFLSDDNNLKLLLSKPLLNWGLPIEVRPVILTISYSEIKNVCDKLSITVIDVIDEASCDVREKLIDGEQIKVCRESDFKEFDELFEILTEEE